MRGHTKSAALILLGASLTAGLASCTRPGGPDVTDEFGDAGQVYTAGLRCLPPRTSEFLPARSSVVMATGGGGVLGNQMLTSELFQRFNTACGACHVIQASGGFQATSTGSFAQVMTQDVVDKYIKSNDPLVFMPPPNFGGKPYASRDASDAVVQLVGLIDLWISQGSPIGSFSLAPGGDAGTNVDGGAASTVDGGSLDGGAAPAAPSSTADYSLTPALGQAMSNIGTCVPSKYIVSTAGSPMDKLDAFFASATSLPATLDETDLTTFDSDQLARNGVVSYFPAYPLWSDAAGKMRHVRVPRNQSIVLDKATQQFQIPPNTRFYKTFFKQVVDASGQLAFRRIETRLIVSRPDQTMPDGTVRQTALFGTYLWDEAERTATLWDGRLHNNQPFSDKEVPYFTDEVKAAAIIASKPLNLDYTLKTTPGLVHHYEVPGAPRCVQCHMGSPSAAFVLGFTPLQVATPAPGASGMIEPATGDELNQLQRLIDYKVISGIEKASDILPLEKTQLPRTYRNDNELTAQAYMVGNCAHCHNPRGFPSTKAPELKDVLNFLPGPNGGIFQFPLDRTSPVRARGIQQDIPIPYITPSIYDIKLAGNDSGTYKDKDVDCTDATGSDGWCLSPLEGSTPPVDYIYAPWRSLIYRNVDTPFDYVEDATIFPHMPLNTPGYDCRAARIMGSWMVSIPATLLNATDDGYDRANAVPVPFVEVRPGDVGYAAAQSAAAMRLGLYQNGHRYKFCPDTGDTVDPDVEAGKALVPGDAPALFNADGTLKMPQDGVPDDGQWTATDLTDPPSDTWLPRQPEWVQTLVNDTQVDHGELPAILEHLKKVVDTVTKISVDDATRQFVSTAVPFGLWKEKPACNFTGVPTAGSIQVSDRPKWMLLQAPNPNAPVYMQSPGEAVFRHICANCHGPQGDATGLLADEVALMSGGTARVANFRTGLFGPVADPGHNRSVVFAPPTVPQGTGSPDDYGARYMSWMALGGTLKLIPKGILDIVATTPVLGRRRVSAAIPPDGTTDTSANMLDLARGLCIDVLAGLTNSNARSLGELFGHDNITQGFRGPINWGRGGSSLVDNQSGLIAANGDAEMWSKLCSWNNQQVVRVLTFTGNAKTAGDVQDYQFDRRDLYWADKYPPGAPVMNDRGQIEFGVKPDNLFPFCMKKPDTLASAVDMALQSHPLAGNVIPYCPDALFQPGAQLTVVTDGVKGNTYPDANQWSLRGAVNAGIAVFVYLDGLSKGQSPLPSYDHCELLTGSSAGH